MAALEFTVNSGSLPELTTQAISDFFTPEAVKRLSISTTDALTNPAVVNPEIAYVYEES